MRIYRNLYLLPKFLNPAAAGNHEFHSAARQLIRLQPFQFSINAATNSPITKEKAIDVVQKLTENERESLREALSQFELNKFKTPQEGKNFFDIIIDDNLTYYTTKMFWS